MRKLAYVDVLRGVAILMVVSYHTMLEGTGLFKMHPYVIPLIAEGARGVQLFFILSAFTLFRSYHFRSQTEKSPIRNFFIRRFFRIAPMFYLAIIGYLVLNSLGPGVWLGNGAIITPALVVSSFTFLSSFSPYWFTTAVPGGWTIGVEVIFYALLPFFFTLIKSTRRAFAFLIFSLLFRSVFINLLNSFPLVADASAWSIFLYFSFPNQLYVFSLGVIMFFIINDDYKVNISPKALVLLAILLTLDYIYKRELFLSAYFQISICFLMVSIALSKYQPKILFNSFFIYTGKVSYSIYLVHFGVLFVMKRLHIIDFVPVHGSLTALLNYLVRLVIALGGCFMLSSATYRLVEQPFIRLAEKLIKTGEGDEGFKHGNQTSLPKVV